MTINGSHISISDELSEHLTVHKNLQQEILLTTTDKVRLCLMEHQGHLSKANDWVAPAGVFLAALATLCAADFKVFLVDASVWKALFIITALGSIVWLIRSLWAKWNGRKHRGIDEVVEKLAAASVHSLSQTTQIANVEPLVQTMLSTPPPTTVVPSRRRIRPEL